MKTLRQVIDANKHKYSISEMCKYLGISRQTYYYQPKKKSEAELEETVTEIFYQNHNHRLAERTLDNEQGHDSDSEAA